MIGCGGALRREPEVGAEPGLEFEWPELGCERIGEVGGPGLVVEAGPSLARELERLLRRIDPQETDPAAAVEVDAESVAIRNGLVERLRGAVPLS